MMKGVKKDVLGRICVKKKDFLAVNGYDETMKHYGFDDYDFLNRLQFLGLTKKVISAPQFLNAITHSTAERMENFITVKLEKLLIKYISPAESTLHFLYTNNTCAVGTIVNNHNFNAITSDVALKKALKYRFSIAEKSWAEGAGKPMMTAL
ncbi:galactosyltransferase-related protein [Mucilaginibacter antarcticus]|uniref:galactosyltransferase-related protein n=1 Tax=Mucilaginibacter antarcticus TaxID=1855725 RepID=UPI003632B8B4